MRETREWSRPGRRPLCEVQQGEALPGCSSRVCVSADPRTHDAYAYVETDWTGPALTNDLHFDDRMQCILGWALRRYEHNPLALLP